jgi:hypothetical protein
MGGPVRSPEQDRPSKALPGGEPSLEASSDANIPLL